MLYAALMSQLVMHAQPITRAVHARGSYFSAALMSQLVLHAQPIPRAVHARGSYSMLP